MIIFENWNPKGMPNPKTPLPSPVFKEGNPYNYMNWTQVKFNQTTEYIPNYSPQKLTIYKNDKFPDERIQYYFTPDKVSIGVKRNVMARLAKGKYIVHMDDDDFYTEKFCADSVLLFNDLQNKSRTNITIIKRLTYLEFDVVLDSKSKYNIRNDNAYFFINNRDKHQGWAFVKFF